MDSLFRNRRVLITGHTGFKGSWMCLVLARAQAQVLGYSLDPPSDPSLFGLARLGQEPPQGLVNVHADILDLPRLKRAVAEFAPDLVVHMAAQSLVRPSYQDPAGTFAANVQGTANVLEACRCAPPTEGRRRAVVIVTSDKCYENREWVYSYREVDRLGGHDPYSASKACAELVATSYAKSFFDPARVEQHRTVLASVRAGNVIGGGDFAVDRLIPDMARAYAAGGSVFIRSPQAVRPWQHVLEPVNAYLKLGGLLLEAGHEYAGSWNFGPPGEAVRTVRDVSERFSALWGAGARLELNPGAPDGPHEATLLTLDCSKARARLKWRPRLNLDQALELTAAWYRAWADGASAQALRALTCEQIDAYQAAGHGDA